MKLSFIMLDYPSLAAVAAVVREGTFERAATMLGMTPSAVSQRVRGLEERIGSILINRGQPCVATSLGSELCAHYDRVRLLEQDLHPLFMPACAPPTLAVAVNADSFATWFQQAVAMFGQDNTAALDFKLDDEAHTAERLRRGEVLAAVSADPKPVPGCKTIALGALRYVACASPAFMARYFKHGVQDESLARAPLLRFDRRDRLQDRWAQAAYQTELHAPVHWVPSTHGFLDLALAGFAWGMQPLCLAKAHLEAGRLVELPPGLRLDVQLYWIVTRLHASALQQLTRAVRMVAAQELLPPEK